MSHSADVGLDQSSTQWPSHGGQAQALLARFGLPQNHPLEDVSANLNPLGPPGWVSRWLSEHIGGLSRYPEPSYCPARQAIAAHHGISPGQVLLTNGGAEAIFLVAALHRGGRAVVPGPSFGEYTRACSAHGVTITHSPLYIPNASLPLAPLITKAQQADLVLLCRPNNPTGGVIEHSAIESLLAQTQASGTQVVVDEAFIELSLGVEALTPLLARYPHLILLRSMTKCYTLPGLRLGYVLAAEKIIAALAAQQPPWSVNHLAAELVAPLIADDAFAERTAQWLADEQPRMAAELAALPLDVMPSQTCFFLLRPAKALRRAGLDSEQLFERLLKRGLLVRHTFSFAGLDGAWLRVALRDKATNDQLLKVLHDCLY